MSELLQPYLDRGNRKEMRQKTTFNLTFRRMQKGGEWSKREKVGDLSRRRERQKFGGKEARVEGRPDRSRSTSNAQKRRERSERKERQRGAKLLLRGYLSWHIALYRKEEKTNSEKEFSDPAIEKERKERRNV